MILIFIRTVILYLIVLIVIRIMGKGELSKMSPFQLVVIFMIAELASIPIESPDVSMITGITAMFTLMLLQVLISFVSIRSEKIKNIFSGRPSVLINKGEINYKELRSLRITINDLLEQLRIGNGSSLTDIDYAILESNGQMSIILKSQSKPLTPKDMSIYKENELMPIVFISDGVIYSDNLKSSGWTHQQLNSEIKNHGIANVSEIFLAFCDSLGKLHIFIADKKSGFAKEVKV